LATMQIRKSLLHDILNVRFWGEAPNHIFIEEEHLQWLRNRLRSLGIGWDQDELDRYLKAEGKGVFTAEVKGALDVEELEFVSIAKDIIEIAFEAEYSGQGQQRLYH
jgi:hypothetical protein